MTHCGHKASRNFAAQQYRGMLFLSCRKYGRDLGSETPRVHHAAWRRGRMAARGARAQADRMLRLGVLKSADAGDPKGKVQLFAFTEELAVLGWADGPNLRMEIRWGGGNVNRASVFAKELVALQPDVILAQGTPVTTALKRETRTIPIVFATVLAKRRAETYDYVETC